jgi:hypothetical protein
MHEQVFPFIFIFFCETFLEQLAAVAVAMKRCAGHAFALPLLLLLACAPAGAVSTAGNHALLSAILCQLFSGLTWDELALITEEQPWREGTTSGRGGSQVHASCCSTVCIVEQLLKGPDVSLTTAISTLCRTDNIKKGSESGNQNSLSPKVAVKKEALDPTSQIGALRQVLPSSHPDASIIQLLRLPPSSFTKSGS